VKVRASTCAAALAFYVLVAAGAGAAAPEEAGAACATSADCSRAAGYGQVCAEARCGPYLDRLDLLEAIGLKKSHGTLEAYKLYPSVIPALGYTPQNGFVFGATTLAGIYLGDPRTTTISSLGLVAFYTSKNQLIIQSRDVAMLEGNAWQLHGDYRLLITNQPTYGLGASTESADTSFTVGGTGTTGTLAGEQPIDFNLLRVHQVVLKRIAGPFYAGASFRFDRYFDIRDNRLDLAAAVPVVTSHYGYSAYNGFNTGAYNASGVGLELVLDSRDSTINAYRGWYLNASLRAYPTALGSAKSATLAYGEARTYVGLDDDVPRNVLAFWVLAQGVLSGELPYLALPSIGWDFAGRTGRGYVQGRFRGTAEVYAEAEWRFRLTNNGLLGGTVFANASTFARPAATGPGSPVSSEALFSTVRPAAGVGLRFMMNREARNNVTLDFAVGQNSGGIYFGAGEAF